MALLIRNRDSNRPLIYLHIPKTGGTWFRQALLAAGVGIEAIGDQHSHFPYLNNFVQQDVARAAHYFVLVRHPITWYQSRWAFRVLNGWQMTHPIDRACASNDFQEWVRNLLDHKCGWVSQLYDMYIGGIPGQECNVGRIECLPDDAIGVLQRVGVDFDAEKFRATPRVNDSTMDGKSSKHWAKYTPELLQRLLDVEADAIHKYYPEYVVDVDQFCGEQPY